MIRKILKIFGVEKKEIWILFLTTMQAILVGAYIGGFDISMHAVFLQSYPFTDIPEVYIISGILGIAMMFVYTFFSTRMPFRIFILLNYLVIVFLSIVIYYYSYLEFNREYVRYGFALMFPMNIMLFLNFWRSMREIFTPPQTKRLIIHLQIAFYGGTVAASYGIILYLYQTREFQHIVLFSSIGIIIVILLQLIVNPTHRFSKLLQHKPKKTNPLRSKFLELFYARYTVFLLIFVMLSAIIGYIAHYNFINVSRTIYPDIVGFSKFLGLFTGTLFLFIFFIDKFFIRKVLYSYDSPYSLVIIPIAMMVLVILAVIINLVLGNAIFFARFSFSFILIAIVKLAYEISKFEIEIPSLRVLFRTLDVRFHNSIIPRIDGTTRALGLVLAGSILFFIIKIKFINSLYLNLLAIVFVIGWFYVTIKLIKAYQDALQNNIRRYKATKRKDEREVSATDEKLLALINHGSSGKVISSLRISESIEPVAYENHIINLLNYSDPEVQDYVLSEVDKNNLLIALPTLKRVTLGSDPLESLRNELVQRFEQKISMGKSEKQIEKLANSINVNDRVLAAELIGYLNKKEYSSVLINLSRDFEPDVKEVSIKAMARAGFAENSHTLVGFLNSTIYYPFAFEALVKIGDEACDHLDQIFLSPDSDNRLLSRIVKIFGKIGSQKAIESLLNKVEKQNKFIARQAIVALREARFQASLRNINQILNAIIRTTNIMSWNLSILHMIPYKNEYALLRKAMESEMEDNYNLLYHLLSLAYNSNSISNIRKLLEEGGDTDISFAIELLDQIVYDDVKQVLFPVLENLSMKGRIRQLQYFFPTEKITIFELIPEIITRDFNQISIYVKACAIFSWSVMRKDVDDILISCLFHPNKLIRETSAFTINEINPQMLTEIYPRLEPSYVSDIIASLENIKSGNDILLLEKIEFLKKCYGFRKISEDILFELAMCLKFRRISENENLVAGGNEHEFSLVFVYNGEVEVNYTKSGSSVHTAYEIIYFDPLLAENQNQLKIKALKDSVIFSVSKDVLHTLIFDYTELRGIVLELIDKMR
jgi:AAA family ATP:ADP antiporter